MDFEYEEEVYITRAYKYGKYICDRPNLKKAVIEVNDRLEQFDYSSFRKVKIEELIDRSKKSINDTILKIQQLEEEIRKAEQRIPLEETYIALIERQLPALHTRFESLDVAVKLMGKDAKSNAALDTKRSHQNLWRNIQSCNNKIYNYQKRAKNFKEKIEKNKLEIIKLKEELADLKNQKKEMEKKL